MDPSSVDKSKNVEIEYLAKKEDDFIAPFFQESKADAVTEALNDMASQGWELIQIDREYNHLFTTYVLTGDGNRLQNLQFQDSVNYIFRRVK